MTKEAITAETVGVGMRRVLAGKMQELMLADKPMQLAEVMVATEVLSLPFAYGVSEQAAVEGMRRWANGQDSRLVRQLILVTAQNLYNFGQFREGKFTQPWHESEGSEKYLLSYAKAFSLVGEVAGKLMGMPKRGNFITFSEGEIGVKDEGKEWFDDLLTTTSEYNPTEGKLEQAINDRYIIALKGSDLSKEEKSTRLAKMVGKQQVNLLQRMAINAHLAWVDSQIKTQPNRVPDVRQDIDDVSRVKREDGKEHDPLQAPFMVLGATSQNKNMMSPAAVLMALRRDWAGGGREKLKAKLEAISAGQNPKALEALSAEVHAAWAVFTLAQKGIEEGMKHQLKPYKDLSEQEKGYDRDVVLTTAKMLMEVL